MKSEQQKPAKKEGTVTLIFEPEILGTVKRLAEDDDRSVNNYVNRFFKKYLPLELESVEAAKANQQERQVA